MNSHSSGGRKEDMDIGINNQTDLPVDYTDTHNGTPSQSNRPMTNMETHSGLVRQRTHYPREEIRKTIITNAVIIFSAAVRLFVYIPTVTKNEQE